MKRFLLVMLVLCFASLGLAFAGGDGEGSEPIEIDEQVLREMAELFPNSVFTVEERMNELRWFAEAAAPYRGTTIKVASETVNMHVWESEVLTAAFKELTGITVEQDIINEGMLIERLYTQMASSQPIYDLYANDTDLIGTHLRRNKVVVLSDFMEGEGAAITNPDLDLDDWLNLEFGMDYDGNILQIPDGQFVNLYIFRYDWFENPEYKAEFEGKYGYELGVPLNWTAYEDIAEFFTNDVKEIDGHRIYGHGDHGKPDPSLGWRIGDAWLTIAGVGDLGLPNGLPVDDWGLRVEDRIPVGFSVSRGGALNSPASIYAIQTYIDWLHEYAPPEAAGQDTYEAAFQLGNERVAQSIWMYTAFLSGPEYVNLVDDEGYPLWRVAPTPHGKYWQEGMKIGYQDQPAWTIPTCTPPERRDASWLYAQFCVSKTVSVDKFIAGTMPTRRSTVFSDYAEENLGRYGGLLTFYRSPMYNMFTPTGVNPPDYGLFQEQIWHFIAPAMTGESSVEDAMNDLAAQNDMLLSKLYLPVYSPQLAEEVDPEYWLNQPGAPWPEITTEPEPRTMPYDEMVEAWEAGQTTF